LTGHFTQPVLTFKSLSALGVFHGVTTRSWGSVNPFVGYEAIERLQAGVKLQPDKPLASHVVFPEEVHGKGVHPCVASDGGSIRLGMDGLSTGDPSLILTVYAADCIPLFLYDRKENIVCLLHAGRRGLMSGIVGAATATLSQAYGCKPRDLVAGLGPGLRSCCYSIREDIFGEIEKAGWAGYVASRNGGYYLDLTAACTASLIGVGLGEGSIEDMGICTACRTDLLYSARCRKDGEERGASIAGLVSPCGQ
jgi:YfiH family protein